MYSFSLGQMPPELRLPERIEPVRYVAPELPLPPTLTLPERIEPVRYVAPELPLPTLMLPERIEPVRYVEPVRLPTPAQIVPPTPRYREPEPVTTPPPEAYHRQITPVTGRYMTPERIAEEAEEARREAVATAEGKPAGWSVSLWEQHKRQQAEERERAAPKKVPRREPAASSVRAIVDEQIERYEIARMAGSIQSEVYDKIVKNAGTLYLIQEFGLQLHPYSVPKALNDKIIRDADVKNAQRAIKDELRRRDYKRGGKLQAEFEPEHGVTPHFGVGYQWRNANQVTQAAITLAAGGIPGQKRALLLDECIGMQAAAMRAIESDPDAEHFSKLASIKLGVSRTVRGGFAHPKQAFFDVMNRMGITCIAPTSPEGIAYKAISQAQTTTTLEVLAKTPRYPIYSALTPASYDALVNNAVRASIELWADHKRRMPDPKFRSREVTGGAGEWTRIVADRMRIAHYYRGELPEQMQIHDAESAKRAVQAVARIFLARARLEPGPVPQATWDFATGSKVYDFAAWAMTQLTSKSQIMRATDIQIHTAGSIRPSRNTKYFKQYRLLTRPVAQEAIRELGYYPAGERTHTIVTPEVAPTRIVPPAPVLRVREPHVSERVTALPSTRQQILEAAVDQVLQRRVSAIRFARPTYIRDAFYNQIAGYVRDEADRNAKQQMIGATYSAAAVKEAITRRGLFPNSALKR